MLGFFLKLIPNDYKWSVAIKKVTWTIAKTGVALLAGTKIGKQVPADQWLAVTEVSAAIMAGGLKFIHDWAKVRFPKATWL